MFDMPENQTKPNQYTIKILNVCQFINDIPIIRYILFSQWPKRSGFNPRSSHTRLKKWYSMPPCLTFSIILY